MRTTVAYCYPGPCNNSCLLGGHGCRLCDYAAALPGGTRGEKIVRKPDIDGRKPATRRKVTAAQ